MDMPPQVPEPPAFIEALKTMELTDAMILIESGGNDYAIGDRQLKNHAYGPLQIRQPCVDDVNRVNGTSHKAEDMLGNRELSLWVFERYMAIYATEKRLGRPVTDIDRARIWNGGPNGYKSNLTLAYGQRIAALTAGIDRGSLA